MPEMMIKAYRIEYYSEIDTAWKTLIHNQLNIRRLDIQHCQQMDIRLLRLIVLDTWGGGPAHLFALDIF